MVEIPGYKVSAKALQEEADKVYAIGYDAPFDDFEALRINIASETNYFKNSYDADEVFEEIFSEIVANINEKIDGSSIIDETNEISTNIALDGKWICLKNNSECSFYINNDNTMEGNIDINSTKIILKEGDTPKEGEASGLTLVEWSNKGYIGKHDNYLYLNLENFSASGEITVEIVQ